MHIYIYICPFLNSELRQGLKLPVIWPDEMRWWGRLLISMDNLTYFLWFWTAFFWTLGRFSRP